MRAVVLPPYNVLGYPVQKKVSGTTNVFKMRILSHSITVSDLEEFCDICDDGSEDEFVFLTVEPAQFCYSREKSNKTLKDKIFVTRLFLR